MIAMRYYFLPVKKDVEKFVEKLTNEEAAGFFADASEWKSEAA